MLTLKVKICGNIDRGQDPRRAPYGLKTNNVFKAETMDGLKKLAREFISENQLGGGNWRSATVQYKGQTLHMGYNGRLWDSAFAFDKAPPKEVVVS